MKIKIEKINPLLELPHYKYKGDAGMDLYNAGEDVTLEPGGRALIPSGIRVAIPYGYELQVRPRSGLAIKKGITVLNTPGTIDSTYRGEIKVIVFNTTKDPVKIESKERIAQLVLNKIEEIEWEECRGLEKTERGGGGFGSTGFKDGE